METTAKRRSALWAVVWAGAMWGAVGAAPVPACAQKSPTVASAASNPSGVALYQPEAQSRNRQITR